MDRQEALETYRLLREHGHDNGALVFADKLAAMMEKESDEAEPFYEMSAEEFEASEEAGGRWRSAKEGELPEYGTMVEVEGGEEVFYDDEGLWVDEDSTILEPPEKWRPIPVPPTMGKSDADGWCSAEDGVPLEFCSVEVIPRGGGQTKKMFWGGAKGLAWRDQSNADIVDEEPAYWRYPQK